MCKGELENLSMTGKISGKRSRGRKRLTYMDSISRWANMKVIEVLKIMKDRKGWKSMIVNVLEEQDT